MTRLLHSSLFLCLATAACFAQTISSVNPIAADAGQVLPITITCSGDQFQTCYTQVSWTTCNSNISRVYIKQNATIQTAKSISVNGNTALTATLPVTLTSATGAWDLAVEHTGGATLWKYQGFTIGPVSAPLIDSIVPATVFWTKQTTVAIYGKHTHFQIFLNDSIKNNVQAVRLTRGATSVQADSFNIRNSQYMTASFTMPASSDTGGFALEVMQKNSLPGAVLNDAMNVRSMLTLDALIPDSGSPGQFLTVSIVASNSYFTIDSSDQSLPNIKELYLYSGSQKVTPVAVRALSPTIAEADFLIGSSAGIYSLVVNQNRNYFGDTLPDCFRITQSTAYLPAIVSVSPDSGYPGQSFWLQIQCARTHFMPDSTPENVSNAVLTVGNYLQISADSILVQSDSSLKAKFTLSSSVAALPCSVRIMQDRGFPPAMCKNCFKVVTMSQPLTITNNVPDSFIVDSLYRIQLKSSFVTPGFSVTYMLLQSASGMSISSDTLIWKPTAADTTGKIIKIRASESSGRADTLIKTVKVFSRPTVGIGASHRLSAQKFATEISSTPEGLRIRLAIPETMPEVQLGLYDLKGKWLGSWHIARKGFFAINVEPQKLPKGLLIMRVRCGQEDKHLSVFVR
jgi:hypothetical protein